jgi:hypothetical protein
LAGLRLWLKRLRLWLWQNNGFFGEAEAILLSVWQNGCGCGFYVTCGEEAARSHYFWLHLRSTNCKMASQWLQLGSRFFVRGLAGLL